MMDELKKLKELTEVLTGNGYLRNQAEEWEYALDAIPEFVYVIDVNHNLKFVNKILAQRLGASKDDLYNKKCYHIIKGKQVDSEGECLFAEDCCDLDAAVQTSGEIYLEKLDGWFVYDRSPIYTKTNKLIGFICILRDVTDRKAAEHVIERNEDRLSAALELSMMHNVDETELTDYVLEQAVALTESKIGYMHFVDESAPGEVELNLFKWSKAAHKNCKAEKTDHYPLEKAGIWADCIRKRKPVVHNDYAKEASKQGLPEGHFPVTRHMSVPVMDDGRIVAVLGVGNKEEPYDAADIRQLSLFLNTMWDIIKHRRLEENFTDLINSTPVGIHSYRLVNDELILIHFNPAAQKTLGMDASRCLGKKLEDVFPMLADTEVPTVYRDIARSGGTWEEEGFVYKDDSIGVDGVFSVFAYQVKQDEMAVLFEDIKEKFEAAAALKESESRYKQIFDVAPAGIYELDYRTGKIVNVNDAVCEYSGYSKEELLSMDAINLLTEDSKKAFESRILKVLAGEELIPTVEYEIIKKNGDTAWLKLNNKHIYENGELVGATVVATDITKRKHVEEDIKNNLKNFLTKVDKDKKILIVEDQRVISEIFSKALSDRGYDVVVAMDGNRATELIDENGICLVIVDLSLPAGPSGLDIIRKVTVSHGSVPIIVVSGTANVGDVDEAMRAGAWDYIAKPATITDLVATVERNIEQSKLIKKSKLLDEFLELTN